MTERLAECNWLVEVASPCLPIISLTEVGQAIETKVSSLSKTFRMFSFPQTLIVGFPRTCVL